MKANCQKKKHFSGLLFFYRSLKLVHLHVFLPRLQYTYEARFTMSTYLCIQCAQSFTFEHYFAGSLFERYINIYATKGIFQALYRQDQLLLNIFVANVKLDFETYYKVQSKVEKKQMVFMQEFRGKRRMGHVFGRRALKINVK